MATTTAFGSLSVPAPDDTMEMSSPATRNLDDDIDIDFDDYQGGVHLTDDERMVEDGDPTRPATATDDMMEDDVALSEQIPPHEEVMQDDGLQVQELQQEDEELIDYGEEDFQDQAVDDTVIAEVEEPTDVTDIAPDAVDEEVTRVAELQAVEVSAPTLTEEVASGAAQFPDSSANDNDFLGPDTNTEPGVNLLLANSGLGEQESYEDTHELATSQRDQPPTLKDAPQPSMSINTGISAPADTPDTPTDTGLHPMTVRYADRSMPLFKSRRQPDGLLKDDNLANLSLAELIKNCRQQLAVKIGEIVSEDQEVLLGFDSMGLILVEDCRAAFESSLHDVLVVFLQLHQNDGIQQIPPLSLNLSLQLKFQSSFSILKQAAAGGQGMSNFGFLQATDQTHEEAYEDGYDEDASAPEQQGDDYPEDGNEDHSYDQNTYSGRPGEGEEFQARTEIAARVGEEDHEEYYEEDEYHEEMAEGEFPEPEQDEAAARLDELQADEEEGAGALYNASENLDSLTQATFSQHGTLEDGAHTADQQADSTATSVTLQGDSVNSTAEHAGGDQQDFSTFLTEYEVDESKAALPIEEKGLDQVSGARDGSGLPVDATAVDAQNLGSQDFLNEFTTEDYGGEANEGEPNYQEEYQAGEYAEQEGQYDDYQADTYDEQQKENHPDYQPGEDDEQFHTAQDFLNNDYYEHGLEHDIQGEEDGIDDTVGTVIHHDLGEYQDDHEGQQDFEDELGFDDEPAAQEDETTTAPNGNSKISGSPLGKRSFEEHTELDELEYDEPELKKVRSS